MAVRWMDSFDGDSNRNWGTHNHYENATGGTINVSGHNGSSLQLAGNGQLGKTLDNQATLFTHFFVKFSALPAVDHFFLVFRDGANDQIRIDLMSTGKLQCWRGPDSLLLGGGTFVFTAGTWYSLKVLITFNNTAGTIAIYIDDSIDVNLSGKDTAQTANEFANQVWLWNEYGSGITVDYDDYVVADSTAGGISGYFVGALRVAALAPTADGANTAWTPDTGVSHFNRLNEAAADGDTTYNGTSTTGVIDTFVHANMPSSASSIKSVMVTMDSRMTGAGEQIAPVVYHGGSANVGTTVSLTTSYKASYTQCFDTDPGTGIAWTQADIDTNDEFGYKAIA